MTSAPKAGMDPAHLIEKVAQRASELMIGVPSSHGWDHVLRVRALALVLAREEGAQADVVELAALLHDVSRRDEDTSPRRPCHARLGAEAAKRILMELGADPELAERVARCVATHRYRGDDRPGSIEAEVLFDADKLDSIGAIGVGRAFLFAGEVGARLHNPEVGPETQPDHGPEDTALREFLVKLRWVKDRMCTRSGRELARGRHAFMESFFAQIDVETAGLR